MTRSSDLVMVEREVLLHAIARFECLAEDFEAAGELVDWAMCRTDAQRLGRALQSVEGGVQGSIATKQATDETAASVLSDPLIIRKNDDGETVDEIIANNCYFHIEQMSATGFWFCINNSHFYVGARNGRAFVDLKVTDLDDAALTKTPSADHDAGNLRGLADQLENFLRVLESARGAQNKAISVWADDVVIVASAVNALRLAEPNHHQPHALSQGWRDDMENAPRDGTRILVTGGGLGGDVEVAEYSECVGCWNAQTCTLDDRDDEADGYSAPTHWMPLPAPPVPENTPRDSSESTTGGAAPDHTTMEERGR